MNIPLKRCSLCGEEKPATSKVFTTRKNSKDGLGSWCRECYRDYMLQRSHGDNHEQWLSDRQFETDKKAQGLKRCGGKESCVHNLGCWQPATNQFFTKNKHGIDGMDTYCKACKAAHHAKNKDVINAKNRAKYDPVKESAQQKRSYLKHSAKRKAYVTEWRKKNPDKVRFYNENWKRDNLDKILEKGRRWVLNNPEKATMKTQRRLARKRDLPHSMTDTDWRYALEYFNHSCAVCGKSFAKVECHADHWIPLHHRDCPGTVPANIIPLCGGRGGCNQRKSAKMPLQWLIQIYGEETALTIYARIQAYIISVT